MAELLLSLLPWEEAVFNVKHNASMALKMVPLFEIPPV